MPRLPDVWRVSRETAHAMPVTREGSDCGTRCHGSGRTLARQPSTRVGVRSLRPEVARPFVGRARCVVSRMAGHGATAPGAAVRAPRATPPSVAESVRPQRRWPPGSQGRSGWERCWTVARARRGGASCPRDVRQDHEPAALDARFLRVCRRSRCRVAAWLGSSRDAQGRGGLSCAAPPPALGGRLRGSRTPAEPPGPPRGRKYTHGEMRRQGGRWGLSGSGDWLTAITVARSAPVGDAQTACGAAPRGRWRQTNARASCRTPRCSQPRVPSTAASGIGTATLRCARRPSAPLGQRGAVYGSRDARRPP